MRILGVAFWSVTGAAALASVGCGSSTCAETADGVCPGSTPVAPTDGGEAGATAASDGSAGSGAACASSATCGKGLACGFALADACTATGVCVPFTPGLNCLLAPVCACTGETLNTRGCGFDPKYASQPIRHDGPC